MNYYNEIDPFAVKWLHELIKAGLIPDGEIDNRSIEDVKGSDLKGFTQCHFFAGIGGWSYALRLAGWPEDRNVWTGSCPCQPFSVAGRGQGTKDERHLWPEFFRLIKECKPDTVFGEQVVSAEVVGYAKSDENLYRLQEGKDVDGIQAIFRERKIRSSSFMQNMPEGIRKELEITNKGVSSKTEKKAFCKKCSLCKGIQNKERCEIFDWGMSQEVSKEWDSFRSGSTYRRYSDAYRQWLLRGNWNFFQQNTPKGKAVQLSLFGSDNTGEGISLQQHQDCSCGCESNDRELGFGKNNRNSKGNDQVSGEINDSKRNLTTKTNKEDDGQAKTVWLDGVFNDLEAEGYACGAIAVPACSIGAPHIRQRLWWVADSNSYSHKQDGRRPQEKSGVQEKHRAEVCGGVFRRTGAAPNVRVADRTEQGSQRLQRSRHMELQGRKEPVRSTWACQPVDYTKTVWWPCRDGKWRRIPGRWMALTPGVRHEEHGIQQSELSFQSDQDCNDSQQWMGNAGDLRGQNIIRKLESLERPAWDHEAAGSGASGEGLSDNRISDTANSDRGSRKSGPEKGTGPGEKRGQRYPGSGKNFLKSLSGMYVNPGYVRLEIEPTLFPLVDGISNRMGLLRGAGNAIVPEVAAVFIRSFTDVMEDIHEKES